MITCIPARYVRFSIDYSERKGLPPTRQVCLLRLLKAYTL